jgi:hypothetical protein
MYWFYLSYNENPVKTTCLSRCRREVNDAYVFRVTFLGTKIVVCVHLVHPLRQVFFEFPNKLVPECGYRWLAATDIWSGTTRHLVRNNKVLSTG